MSSWSLFAALLFASGPALAADPLPDAVAQVLTHAAAQGLPTGPLEAKAREGLAKGVPPARIAGALGQLEASMLATSVALGDSLSGSDPAAHLVAGGAALTAGSSPAALRSLADASPEHAIAATRTYGDLLSHGFSEPQALDLVGGAFRGGDPGLALSGLSTTAASLVGSGLSPTIVTETLKTSHGQGHAYAYGHDKQDNWKNGNGGNNGNGNGGEK